MTQKNNTENPWTAEDERGHTDRTLEWWSVIGFFTSLEDQKQWSIKVVLSEGYTTPKHDGSLCSIALLDRQTNHHYIYLIRHPDTHMQFRRDIFEVHHDDSFLKGTYPSYTGHFRDPDNDIDIDFTLHAESLPHWVAQDATNGWLPMALGFFRYGFIPKNRLTGTIKMKDKILTFEGYGYFEHIWGDFSYRNPFTQWKSYKKTISTYFSLLQWWLRNRKFHIPTTIKLSTENNPLGYDWVWVMFDNGWTLFYGNFLGWMMEGPAPGILILSKDGKHYTEFNNIHFRYNKTQTARTFDFEYPTDLEITAKNQTETLHLRFTMTSESREFVSRFPKGRYWRGFVICEAPGKASGYYADNQGKIPLSGMCKIEPQRQVSVIGHNSLRIDILKPPRGVGIALEIDTHYLGKKMTAHLQLAPKPLLRFSCKKSKEFGQTGTRKSLE
jgi:hypothetical protein